MSRGSAGSLEVGLSAATHQLLTEREGITAAMMVIGVDPHKSTHTATAVDPQTNQPVASVRIQATLSEYRRMLTWARSRGAPRGTWGSRDRTGITPAFAGSTEPFREVSRGRRDHPRVRGSTCLVIPACSAERDHPRVRGEHLAARVTVNQCHGSPPRSRGAHRQQRHPAVRVGITPAFAGSTPLDTNATRATVP